jgi:hypothetical protein
MGASLNGEHFPHQEDFPNGFITRVRGIFLHDPSPSAYTQDPA